MGWAEASAAGATAGAAAAGRVLRATDLRSAAPETFAAFAITPPGIERIAQVELARLGIIGEVAAGGVTWTGPIESVARANLWSRTASRIVVRVLEFRARTFWELERHARRLPWQRFLRPGAPVRFRVTSRKSRLYHTDAIAQRLAEAATAMAEATRIGPATTPDVSAGTADEPDGYEDDDPDDEAHGQLFVVRVVRDAFTVSVDTSGSLLHRRGYRQAVAKAPLRETLAAAMLLGSEWPAAAPLLDPLCGSGTIPIEAALIARQIAPGIGRDFALRHWPDFDLALWGRLVDAAHEQQRHRAAAPIFGSDRDEGAIRAARANAERAGVAADIELDVRPISAIDPPPDPGWVVTNPPYGVRIGEADSVRNLYAALGKVLRARCRGWTVAVLSPSEALDRQIDIPLRERFATRNGGLAVRLVAGEVAGEGADTARE